MDQKLSPEQNELVAVGASVGAGCHPGVDHHLKAGARAGLKGERLLAAVASAERVIAEAAVRMGDHVRGKLGPTGTEPALLSRLEEALASLGAALGANDATNIEHQLRAALDSRATRPQLEQAIATAKTVQGNAACIHLREAEHLLDESDQGSSASCTDSMAELVAGGGEMNGIAAAMANRRLMFERGCRQPVAPAETNVPPTATTAAGRCTKEG